MGKLSPVMKRLTSVTHLAGGDWVAADGCRPTMLHRKVAAWGIALGDDAYTERDAVDHEFLERSSGR